MSICLEGNILVTDCIDEGDAPEYVANNALLLGEIWRCDIKIIFLSQNMRR